MKVKQLKTLLEGVDEELDVVVMNLDNPNALVISYEDTGEITFTGACDEDGNLLPDGNDERYDVKLFVISVK